MTCIHQGDPKTCRTCYRKTQPVKTYIYKDDRVIRDGIPMLPMKKEKFCKLHLSIWGKKGSWWCLYAIWMDKLTDICEEEYLFVEA